MDPVVERHVIIHHPCRVEPSLDRTANTEPVEVAGVADSLNRFVNGRHQESVDGRLDDFGHRASRMCDHGRPAGHCFHHTEAKRLVDTPVITTIHGFASDATLPAYLEYADRVQSVAISDADRHPALPYAGTIHHGIDIGSFEVGPGGDSLVFFGRIHPDKGTATAIEVANRAGIPLVIAGIVQDHEYFETAVEPHVDGEGVSYLGPVGPDRRQEVLGSARALLHLIDFDEPFGFSVVEAMACGTPVIAYARGSMPEIIQPGINGYLVSMIDEAVEAARDADRLDRLGVRHSIERRFDAARMVGDYVALYRRILARG